MKVLQFSKLQPCYLYIIIVIVAYVYWFLIHEFAFCSTIRFFFFREKQDHFYEMTNFNEGPSINISVRRTHLYEDAFDKLSPDNGKYI